MKTTLNGGNFGGMSVEAADDVVLFGLQDNSGVWLYDKKRHVNTQTADFIGMASPEDERLTEPTTVVIQVPQEQ